MLSDSNYLTVLEEEGGTTKTPIRVTSEDPKYKKQQPFYLWLPIETIKRIYELTTQYSHSYDHNSMKTFPVT